MSNSNITLMRHICAVLVIVSHLNWLQGDMYDPFRRLGLYAVAVFFGLSGFLLTRSLCRKNDVVGFIRNRFLRIFPGFTFILFITAFIFAPIVQSRNFKRVSFPGSENLEYFFYNLSTEIVKPTIGKSLGNLPVQNWNPSLWTISYEIMCYLGLLILYLLFKQKLNFAVFTVTFTSIISWAVVGIFDLVIPMRIHLLLYYLSFFTLGCTFYFLNLEKRKFIAQVSFVFLTFIYFLPYRSPIEYFERKDFLIGILLVPISLYICNTLKVEIRFRNDYSYGLYIFGAPVTQIFLSFRLDRHVNEFGLYASIILTTFFCAYVSWHLVESKAMLLKI